MFCPLNVLSNCRTYFARFCGLFHDTVCLTLSTFISYLTKLPVLRLHSVDNRMINEFEVVGGIIISWGQQICPSATSSITKPRSPDLGSNTGRHGGKPGTNTLSYVTAHSTIIRAVKHCAVKKYAGWDIVPS